jgi:hypothetical protein
MNRLTWALYLIGTALVLGSWFGLVPAVVAWAGWGVATLIALVVWVGWLRPGRAPDAADRPWREDPRLFTREEEDAARREVDGEEGV